MKPKTAEQYVELLEQAIFEVEEVRMAAEYDMDSMGGALEFVGDLEKALRDMRASMADGSYRFGEEDLPFMKIVAHQDDMLLPIKPLLRALNETHRYGLDIDED